MVHVDMPSRQMLANCVCALFFADRKRVAHHNPVELCAKMSFACTVHVHSCETLGSEAGFWVCMAAYIPSHMYMFRCSVGWRIHNSCAVHRVKGRHKVAQSSQHTLQNANQSWPWVCGYWQIYKLSSRLRL